MLNLHLLTAAEAASMIRERTISSVELMEALLERSRSLEPDLRVWVTLDEDAALATARARDRELDTEGPRGPLHGVPVGIKDIYNTQGVLTTACSRILADFVPDHDSTAVSMLRRAGAVIMGKTVTTEFACGDPPPTRNPWNPEHTPGGSSSGSAVGVAAGMFPAALGSQTGGSILRPAAFNGVVGLKPTFGRISRHGVVAVAASLDTMGHFARSVEDAALLLTVMSGHDPMDEGSANRPVPDYGAAVGALRSSPRIGLVRRHFWERAGEQARQHADGIAERLAEAGAFVESIDFDIDFDEALAAHSVLMSSEAADVHRDWFAGRADEYSPNIRGVIENGQKVSAVDYLEALEVRRRFAAAFDDALRPYDVALTPATPTAAQRDLSTTGNAMFQAPFTFGGLPTITLPSGHDADGMPLGTQLAAAHWDDARLIAVAAWFERVAGAVWTMPPRI